MTTILTGLGWVAGLAMALYASEKLVQYLTELGAEIHIPLGLLGLAVAFGADGPEVTSALIAVARGASDVGSGVILGSNIYNLAGLLGLSAIIAGRIGTYPGRLAVDGGTNLVLTLGLLLLIGVTALHTVVGAAMILILLFYALIVADPEERLLRLLPRRLYNALREAEAHEPERPSGQAGRLPLTIGLVVLSVVFIVLGSDLLVNTSLTLSSRFGLSSALTGTLILAVATSLPNTWAAISLARRGFGAAAVATAFSSNSINAAIGAGVPSLFTPLHVSAGARAIEAPWLLGMTVLAIGLLSTRWAITRWQGAVLVLGYAAFVAVFIASLI